MPQEWIAEEPYVPKTLDLSRVEIDRLNREKADLLKGLESRLVLDAPKPSQAPLAPAGETDEYEADLLCAPTRLTSRITADGRKLANLASMARRLEEIADRNAEKANASREIANRARNELNAYMRETGLA